MVTTVISIFLKVSNLFTSAGNRRGPRQRDYTLFSWTQRESAWGDPFCSWMNRLVRRSLAPKRLLVFFQQTLSVTVKIIVYEINSQDKRAWFQIDIILFLSGDWLGYQLFEIRSWMKFMLIILKINIMQIRRAKYKN